MTYDAKAGDLRRQSEAAAGLVAAMRADQHDDETVQDTVEGETGLLEAIGAAISEIDECEMMALGLASKEGQIKARAERYKRRIDTLRGLIEQAMLVADMPSIKLPMASLSVKSVPPKPIIIDEAVIPAKFWKQPDPVLDKKALNDAVKAGEEVPGATLSNGGTSLQIRRT